MKTWCTCACGAKKWSRARMCLACRREVQAGDKYEMVPVALEPRELIDSIIARWQGTVS